MKIIFLDFDGVLHTDYHDLVMFRKRLPEYDKFGSIFDPYCVENLKKIIDETGADIVISSSWKKIMTYKGFLEMWNYRKLPGIVTDVTPSSEYSRNRGDEIDVWLEQCKEDCKYVIIDDLDETNFNEHQLSYLLVVDSFYGIDEKTAEKAIKLLNS